MLQHYEGRLGEFDYDDGEFKVFSSCPCNNFTPCIRYIGEGTTVNLPKGCVDISYMFYERKLPKGFTLGKGFNISNVLSMKGLFSNCILPKGFTLGDNFDTSNVEDMSDMFSNCILPKGFTLGDKFDTSNVHDMSGMFFNCVLPEGFTLGDKFDTSHVSDTDNMFADCKLPKGFTLGDKFDTSHVMFMEYMFAGCKLPKGFTLGDKFDTSHVENMDNMFKECVLPNDFTLGDKFDTSKTIGMCNIFEGSVLPESFVLCSKFVKTEKDCLLFTYAKLPSRVVVNENTTEDDIIEQLKKPIFTNVKEESTHTNELKEASACANEFSKLIKKGLPLVEARKEIVENSNFTADTIETTENKIKNKLDKVCSNVIISLFSAKDENKQSTYTVGNVRDELLRKGIPKEIVMESIVTYLEDQVLV